jgi:hypothetical protein
MYLHYNPHFQIIMLRLLFPLRLGEYYKIIAKCHRSNRYLELDDTSIYGINVFHNTISLYIAVPNNHSMIFRIIPLLTNLANYIYMGTKHR